jgi:hypothetical protein
MTGKMCRYIGKWTPWSYLFPDVPEPDTGYRDEGLTGGDRLRSRRVTCPMCKRRVMADVRVGNDGDVIWRIPPHKRKMWWKK